MVTVGFRKSRRGGTTSQAPTRGESVAEMGAGAEQEQEGKGKREEGRSDAYGERGMLCLAVYGGHWVNGLRCKARATGIGGEVCKQPRAGTEFDASASGRDKKRLANVA